MTYPRLLLLLTFASSLCACGKTLPVRTETVEVTKYIRSPLPSELTSPLDVYVPAPLCSDPETGKAVLCNGQLAQLLLDYRSALGQCNADRKAAADAQPPATSAGSSNGRGP